MMCSLKFLRHRQRALTLSCFVFAFAAAIGMSDTAQASDVVRIEEDWIVEVGIPEPDKTAPQIICMFSPDGTFNGSYAIFELNHSTMPNYQSGGMQLQCWLGDNLYEHRNSPATAVLSNENEVIRFTVVTTVSNNVIEYEIVGGTSTTWGAFGGQGYLKTGNPTWRTNLNTYNSNFSIQKSKIGFAKHRVQLLARKEVRKYSSSGLISQTTQQDVVHSHSSN